MTSKNVLVPRRGVLTPEMRADLRAIELRPVNGARYVAIRHDTMVDMIGEGAARAGFDFEIEKVKLLGIEWPGRQVYGLGVLRHRQAAKTNGHAPVVLKEWSHGGSGLGDLARHEVLEGKVATPDPLSLTAVIAWVNSYDGSTSAKIAFGERVFACSNTSFNGQTVVIHKHTTNAVSNITERLTTAFGAALDHLRNTEAWFDAMKTIDASNGYLADHVMVEALRAQAMPARLLGAWDRAFREPPFAAFDQTDGSLYNLYNAATWVWQHEAREEAVPGLSRRLRGVIDATGVIDVTARVIA